MVMDRVTSTCDTDKAKEADPSVIQCISEDEDE